MSRSHKHVPGYTSGYGTKERHFFKVRANRRVRRSTAVVSGMMYKKLYDSYNICDFRFLFFTKQDWIPYEIRCKSRKRPYIKDARRAWRAWRK